MHRYLFFLGREPILSTAELRAVFGRKNIPVTIQKCHTDTVLVETTTTLPAQELMESLGGTVKIATYSMTATHIPPSQAIITHLVTAQPTGKIVFAISGSHAGILAEKVKQGLREQGRGARYIRIQNTASILHNDLVPKQGDVTVVGQDVYVTAAIQPIEALSARDYGRPERDDKGGMLPPKLAKMMINIAGIKEDTTILDPFCGSGTILMEAMVMGYTQLIGADILPQAIQATKKNLEWFRSEYELAASTRQANYELHNWDVHSLHTAIKPHSIDAIITEPYLGKPLTGRESRSFLEHQAQELSHLYVAAFAAFATIIKPNGAIVFVTPSFRYRTDWIGVPCTPEIKKLGFAPTLFDGHEFLRYHRPRQHVARDIWKWVRPSRSQ